MYRTTFFAAIGFTAVLLFLSLQGLRLIWDVLNNIDDTLDTFLTFAFCIAGTVSLGYNAFSIGADTVDDYTRADLSPTE